MNLRNLPIHSIDYSNPKAIQGLLRFYYTFKSEMEYCPNFDMIDILADIDNAIKKCNLTDRQRKIVSMYMLGYVEEKIGEKFGITQQAVNKHLQYSCKKIAEYLSQ